jgi:hypothetical protein
MDFELHATEVTDLCPMPVRLCPIFRTGGASWEGKPWIEASEGCTVRNRHARRTETIPALAHEIPPGLLTKILRDLGLTRRDL